MTVPGIGGAPHQLTEELIEALADIVRAGNFRYIASQRMGVPITTFRQWLVRGRKERAAGKETLQVKLLIALDKAEAECHQTLLQDVLSAEGPGAERLKMDFLKARYNKLYSKNPNAHLDDGTMEETKVDALELIADRLRTLMED